MSQPASKKNNIWGDGSPPAPWCPSACAGMEAGEPWEAIKLPVSLPPRCWLGWMCHGGTRGVGLLAAASTLPLKALGWSKAHRHSRGQLLCLVGEGYGEGAADLGCLQPPSLLPAPTWPRSSRTAGANPLSGVLPGNFQLLLPDASAESPRRCWESFPNPARGALPRWQPGSAAAQPASACSPSPNPR